MALETSLVIKGDQSGAKKAIDDTARGIDALGKSAEQAKVPIGDVATGVKETADAAPKAQSGVANLGLAVDTAGGKFTLLRSAAAGAIGGIVAGLAAGALPAAFELAGQVAGAFFTAVADGAARTKQDLQDHKDLVDQIKGAYAEAEGAASSYGNASASFLKFKAQQDVSRLSGDLADQQSGLFNRGAQFGTNPLDPGAVSGTPFEQTVDKFRADLRDGTADVIAFRTQISNIALALPAGDKNRTLAESILGSTDDAAKTQEELARSIDLLKGLQGNADATATALGGSADKFGTLADKADTLNPKLATTNALLQSISGASGGFDGIGLGPGYSPSGQQLLGGGAAGGYDDIGLGPSYAGNGTKLFAAGGFTGDGDVGEPAGIVHGKEFVVNAAATARNRPLLEAMNRGLPGYAAGGYVSGYTTASGQQVAGYYRGGDASGLGQVFGALSSVATDARTALGGLVSEIGRASNPLQQLGAVAATAGQRILSFAAGALDSLANRAFNAAGNSLFGAIIPGFAGGGYTGDGDIGAAAGIVHNKEFVVHAAATARNRPLLEAINRGLPGYAAGGLVGGTVAPFDASPSSGGGAGFVFAPHTTIDARGATLTEAQIKALLDQRDAAWAEKLPTAIGYYNSNPRRRP